ncbi:hypothetical protein [Shewanella atlantica]|uniref:hypothetical protein n=1 Tax=Shewanella atlantica TaxID=271099 RepID=UPI001FED113C|nr:hypothetical protein [Shewanella atlantica]
MTKLCAQTGGHSALNPILYPDINPDIIVAIVKDDRKVVNQNSFFPILISPIESR